ncbi:MAG: hypothetical protein NT091_00935 [Candidatus Falkowbacteria bacterium]|nr:hypothetical protein [Candidatus Falkowbacteria bacterium]
MPEKNNQDNQSEEDYDEEDDDEYDEEEEHEMDRARDLRQAQKQAKMEKEQAALEEAEQAKQSEQNSEENPDDPSNITKRVFDARLRGAWYLLLATAGLSVLYIDLHIFMRMVVGRQTFCKLGDEWPSLTGTQRTMARMAEIFVLFIAHFVLLIVILLISILLYKLLNLSILDQVKMLFGVIKL